MRSFADSDFISATSEVRQLGGFWIAGSLHRLEQRAQGEGNGQRHAPTLREIILAAGIAIATCGWLANQL